MSVQLDQITDDVARDKIGSNAGDSLDNKATLVNDKHDLPIDVSLSGDVITIEAGTKQGLESDGAGSTQNAYKRRLPLISNNDISPAESTINLTTGATTGDFKNNPPTCPTLTVSYYIQMGIELRADGKYYVIFGNEASSIASTTPPSFSVGSIQRLIIILKDSGGGGTWNFNTPVKSDLEIISIGGSGGGGTGGGGKSVYAILDAETDSIGDWTSGNNATLGNGGSLAGTLEISESSPLSGTKSYQYTMIAGSLNDWWISREIDLSTRSIGKDNGIKSPFLYDGDKDDISCYVRYYNGSTWTTITDSEIKIPNAETVTDKLLPIGFLPTNATKIAFAFHVKVANPTKILKWDDSEFIDEPYFFKNLTDKYLGIGNLASASVTTTPTAFSISSITGNMTLSGGGILITRSGKYRVTNSVETWGNNETIKLGYDIDGTITEGQTRRAAKNVAGEYSQTQEVWEIDLVAGEIIKPTYYSSLARTWGAVQFIVEAIFETEYVMTPIKSNMTDWESFTPTGSWTSNTTYTGKRRRVGDSMEIVYLVATSGAPTATGLTLNIPSGFTVDETKVLNGNVADNPGSAVFKEGGVGYYTGNSGYNSAINKITVYAKPSSASLTPTTQVIPFTWGANDIVQIKITLPITGWSSDVVILGAMPIQKIAYIQEVNLGSGGASSTETVHIRSLNTLKGDTSFISLSASRVTIIPGKYILRSYCTGYQTFYQASLIYNVTTSSYEDTEVSSLYMHGTMIFEQVVTSSIVITITVPTTYELHHYIETANAAGLGLNSRDRPNNPATKNVHAQIEIIKIR